MKDEKEMMFFFNCCDILRATLKNQRTSKKYIVFSFVFFLSNHNKDQDVFCSFLKKNVYLCLLHFYLTTY